VETLVAASEQDVRNVVTFECPFGERASAKKFRVIGVCKDDEDVLRRVPSVRVCQVLGSGSQI
jgi:hypothetical protein